MEGQELGRQGRWRGADPGIRVAPVSRLLSSCPSSFLSAYPNSVALFLVVFVALCEGFFHCGRRLHRTYFPAEVDYRLTGGGRVESNRRSGRV
jgi:hypothetical protein